MGACIALAQIDQVAQVVGLEHQQGQRVRAFRIAGAESPHQVAEGLGQRDLVIAGQFPQVLAGPQDQHPGLLEVLACGSADFIVDLVDAVHVGRIVVEQVQEHRVQQDAHDLCHRHVAGDDGLLVFRLPALEAGGNRDDAPGPQVHGRRQRGDGTDAAVAVPVAVDPHGGEDQRQGGGGHDVLDGDLRVFAAPSRTQPVLGDIALQPGHRDTGAVVGAGDGQHAQAAPFEVFPDAGDGVGGFRVQPPLQHPAQRVIVQQAVPAPAQAFSAQHQAQAPAHEVAQEIAAVGAKYPVFGEVQPQVGQAFHRLLESARVGRQVHRVDGPGGYAREDRGLEIIEMPADVTQHPNLVGSARTASGHRQGEVSVD